MGRFNEVKLVSTAPTFRQVHDLLWKEWATAYQNKYPELKRGRLNETELWIDSETFARGFSPRKKAQSETGQGTDSAFQGYHAKFLLIVLFDEATGIDASLWKMAEGLMTAGRRVLFLAIGNPTSRNCEFFKKTQDRMWKHYSIKCFDSPNLKAAGINSTEDIKAEVEAIQTLSDAEAIERLSSYPCPVPYLINARWVIEKAIEWGVDHPLFKGKVIGEFPDMDSNILISDEDVLRSWKLPDYDLNKCETGYIGLDVARFGEDKSVLTAVIGKQQVSRFAMAKQDTSQVVGYSLRNIRELNVKYPHIKRWRMAVDGGFGHGVIDRFLELQKDNDETKSRETLENVEILEINFGSSDWNLFHTGWKGETLTEQQKQTREYKKKARRIQEDRENYTNFKSKMFDLLSKDIKDNGVKILSLEVYKKQLPTIKTDIDSKGRLKIESKEDYKKRTGEPSPDDSDSLALCNFARYFALKSAGLLDALQQSDFRGARNVKNNPLFNRLKR